MGRGALLLLVAVAAETGRTPRDLDDHTLRLIRHAGPFHENEKAKLARLPARFARCATQLAYFDVYDSEACGMKREASGCDGQWPSVSAVLPHRGREATTARALASVLAAFRLYCGAGEVVLARDGPAADATAAKRLTHLVERVAAHWEAIEVVETSARSIAAGYGDAIATGCRRATGDYVLLLNNDVTLAPLTLRVMAAHLNARSGTAAVGARLVDENGDLQEAGAVVFRDGGAMQFSKVWGSLNPLFRYSRSVDYSSAACLMVRSTLLANGFDEQFRPAYYEDTDLAMRLRHDHGTSVDYVPFAVAVHEGSATYGGDRIAEKERQMDRNRDTFVRKWSAELSCHYSSMIPWASRGAFLLATCHSRLRVLVLDHDTPCASRDSGSVRMLNFIRVLLGRRHHVTFAGVESSSDDACALPLQVLGAHVTSAGLLGFRSLSAKCDYDLVIVSRRSVAKAWLPLLRTVCPEAPLVVDTVDLHFLREIRELALGKGFAYDTALSAAENARHLLYEHPSLGTTKAWRAYEEGYATELRVMNASDATIVVSGAERRELEALKRQGALRSDLPVAVISNIHDIVNKRQEQAAFSQRKGALFVGNWQHPPNVDAVKFLLEEVLVRDELQALPDDFVVHIAGAGTQPAWLASTTKAGRFEVVNHGFLASFAPLYASCRVALAPLRYGAGVKGKVNQAMLHGVPVVATPIAVEGMHISGEEAVVADGAEDFAQKLVEIYVDEARWRRVQRAAKESVARHFSVDVAAARWASLEKELSLSNDALRQALFEGSSTLQKRASCSRQGRYGTHSLVSLRDRRADAPAFVGIDLKPGTTLKSFAPSSDLRFHGVDADDLETVCAAHKACVGFCLRPEATSRVFLSPIEAITKTEGPGPARCQAAPAAPPTDAVAFARVSQKAPHYVFAAQYKTRKWRISRDAAEAFCAAEKTCTAYCQNPAGNTLFYDKKVGEMRPRGKPDVVPPGWVCVKARRVFNAAPVAPALVGGVPAPAPRRRKSPSASKRAVHKGGL